MDMACSLAILTVNSAWPLADRAGAAWALASSSSSVSTGLVGGRSPIRSVSDSFIIATSLPGLFPFLCRCGPASADGPPAPAPVSAGRADATTAEGAVKESWDSASSVPLLGSALGFAGFLDTLGIKFKSVYDISRQACERTGLERGLHFSLDFNWLGSIHPGQR